MAPVGGAVAGRVAASAADQAYDHEPRPRCLLRTLSGGESSIATSTSDPSAHAQTSAARGQLYQLRVLRASAADFAACVCFVEPAAKDQSSSTRLSTPAATPRHAAGAEPTAADVRIGSAPTCSAPAHANGAGSEGHGARADGHADEPGGARGKRALSADELRSGAFLGVAKRLRDVPPPLTPPPPAPGTPPPPGLFDSDALTAEALRAEAVVRSPASDATSTSPPSLAQAAPAPAPSDLDPEVERELEALHIAKDIAGEDELAEIKPPELSLLQMAVGERKDVIRNIVRRTMDELVSRGQRTGRNHPSLVSLTKLSRLLLQLDGAGLENPTPPPPSHTLFAMHVLEEPDIGRWGEPLPGWFPPFDYGDKYVASVEQAFHTIGRTRGAAFIRVAANAAAAQLTDDRLLLSPLVRTFSGRIRLRALLVALREAGESMAPVKQVANHLTKAALRRLSARSGDREDAVRSAWDAVEALRPVLRNAAPDLFPITFTRALEVLRLAADTASFIAGRSEAASSLLYAEAVARIGEQEAAAGLLQDGIEHLFEAWAMLLRAGASPSRLESRIILSLTEAHLISPTASQLAERVYWCRESDEDLHTEARAYCVLAHLSGAAGRAEEAKRYADRAIELVESMPPEQRESEGVSFSAASLAILACVRTGRMDECFSYARRAVKERLKHSDGAHPALDTSSGGFRHFRPPALDACLEMFRFGLFLYALSDPHELTGVAEAIGGIAELYVRQGQWRRAAICYAEALERIKPFRRAYPPDHPRIVRMKAALWRCKALAQAHLAAAAGLRIPSTASPVAGDAGS